MLKTVGLYEDVSFRFSQWDPNNTDKYIGTAEQWDEAQGAMERILKHLGVPYTVGIDEAAFYGPKLDIRLRTYSVRKILLLLFRLTSYLLNSLIMYYISEGRPEKRPYIIHRTSLGCYERTLALLIEKYAGHFPTWLAPVQVKLLPISDKYADYAAKVEAEFKAAGIKVETDSRAEKIGYKIREARNERVPYIVVVGEKEAADNTLSVRCKGEELRLLCC